MHLHMSASRCAYSLSSAAASSTTATVASLDEYCQKEAARVLATEESNDKSSQYTGRDA